ncbi:hypothetical protein Bca52824_018881 [Brassica carinata]|uniref:F-box associated beta-propeller type 1 domain-containing protein n=1 Tax=Brassica carinata TaxID=52824 RepID=A0A8X8AWT7_BRACI|nr:hypothetical protein Bca52824_018881 [Brassica carinata]
MYLQNLQSLFQEEQFYRQHITHAPTRIMSFRSFDTLLGRISYDNSGERQVIHEKVILNVRYDRVLLGADLVGHCDGLFCLYYEDNTFCVWSPSLRQLTSISTPDFSKWSEMGFGYDPSSKDYKIVQSGASRVIDFPDIGMLHGKVPETLVGENIYWQVCDDRAEVTDKIFSFDMVSETFNYCSGPNYWLGGGGLCTVGVDALSGDIIVWSAQHNEKVGSGAGSIKSWSKICSLSWGVLEISTSCRIDKIRLVSAITYAGLLLVLVNIGREAKLLAYNLKEKSLTNVETSLSLYTCGSLHTYVETLVPIPRWWKL